MNILLYHLGTAFDCFIASSVHKGILDKYPEINIYWLISNNIINVFQYSKNVKKVFCPDNPPDVDVDICLNLYPVDLNAITDKADIKGGLGQDLCLNKFNDILCGSKKTQMNIFEVYYKICGLNWNKQKSDIQYYPRNKSRINRVGIAIKDSKLNSYISSNLDIKDMKLWKVPNKINIFKQLDEINRCNYIITDDFMILNLSTYLKKYVYYLSKDSNNTKPEMFRNGEIFNISNLNILS